jgi:conserved oligomeric Golgi complex subunit 3
MKDARTEVDERLRTVIGELVSGWSARMTGPLSLPPGYGDGQAPPRGRNPAPRKTSVSGTTKNDDAAVALRVRESVEREVPLVRRKVDEYIHDRRTRDMLLRAVLEDVLVKYAAWLENRGIASQGGKAGSRAKGKGREDSVWEEEAFGEWAFGAFGLDQGDGDGDGMDLE